MIDGRRVLGVIAARGGSKGLPRKNILPLGGKPLIAWSIEAAARSKALDRAVVSTDDVEIAEAAKRAGGDVPFLRPPELATDTASIIDAVLHAVDATGDDYSDVVLLQATSPLRTSADIDDAIALYRKAGASSCVAVTQVQKGPWWMYRMDDRGRIQPLLGAHGSANRRQDQPSAYLPNGAVYVAAIEWLRHARTFYCEDTVAFVMPPERSCDIDTALDLKLAELLIAA